jgi:hypothetical protein
MIAQAGGKIMTFTRSLSLVCLNDRVVEIAKSRQPYFEERKRVSNNACVKKANDLLPTLANSTRIAHHLQARGTLLFSLVANRSVQQGGSFKIVIFLSLSPLHTD